MPNLRLVLIFLVLSIVSSVVTTAVSVRFFMPGNAVSAPVSLPLPPTALPNPSLNQLATPQPTSSPAKPDDCQKDRAKFCSDAKDYIQFAACLQDHFEEVSSDCRNVLQAARDSFKPCKGDIAKYCANAGYGGGRMGKCLRQHGDNLSFACAQKVGNAPVPEGK